MVALEDLSLKDILAMSATISTVLQFLTGSVICHRYIRKKSTGETSGFPFISGFLSCFLWLKYGILTREHTVIFVNTIGSCLFFSYTVIYFTFSVNKRIVIRQTLAVGSFILICTLYSAYETDVDKIIRVIGMLRNDTVPNYKLLSMIFIGLVCCCVGVLFFASPLTKLAHVIRTKNTESLPFPIIVASFFVSLQWFIYGLLIDDRFIQIPNLLGCILSSIQLFLYVMYPSRTLFSVSGPTYQQIRTDDGVP
ncbi:sugar transporter SWEET1 isoform X1 [Malaya genurostris]|uniref:sugar transporter SWEET1 isoform X1 n=1 Tax=Malaya genurostris TaxID=325434 RepID=UPI0026F3CD4A|nr:sugar transporter SWEET1 isoform X1 [Malaya genurostris]